MTKLDSSRTISRKKALQGLYAWDIQGSLDELIFTELLELTNEPFTFELINFYKTHQAKIDQTIKNSLHNWSFERLSIIDRNLLRLGVVELMTHTADKAVIINEYLKLSKEFSDTNSSGFINGVLDAVKIS